MPKIYVDILIYLWAAVGFLLAVSFIMPTKVRICLLAGMAGFFPGIGGGLAVAGVWIGVVMTGIAFAGMGPIDTAEAIWPQLVLIVAAAPAVGMLGLMAMFFYFMTKITDDDVETEKVAAVTPTPHQTSTSHTIISCEACSKPNRLPVGRSGFYKCGHCGHRNFRTA